MYRVGETSNTAYPLGHFYSVLILISLYVSVLCMVCLCFVTLFAVYVKFLHKGCFVFVHLWYILQSCEITTEYLFGSFTLICSCQYNPENFNALNLCEAVESVNLQLVADGVMQSMVPLLSLYCKPLRLLWQKKSFDCQNAKKNHYRIVAMMCASF